jgi:hypothetical protein
MRSGHAPIVEVDAVLFRAAKSCFKGNCSFDSKIDEAKTGRLEWPIVQGSPLAPCVATPHLMYSLTHCYGTVSRFCCGCRISSAQKTKSFGDRIFGAFKRPYSLRREILKRLATSKHVRFEAILKGDEESIPQTCDIRHQSVSLQ